MDGIQLVVMHKFEPITSHCKDTKHVFERHYPHTVILYFQQLIDVIGYCHNKGVYHRYLKVSDNEVYHVYGREDKLPNFDHDLDAPSFHMGNFHARFHMGNFHD